MVDAIVSLWIIKPLQMTCYYTIDHWYGSVIIFKASNSNPLNCIFYFLCEIIVHMEHNASVLKRESERLDESNGVQYFISPGFNTKCTLWTYSLLSLGHKHFLHLLQSITLWGLFFLKFPLWYYFSINVVGWNTYF